METIKQLVEPKKDSDDAAAWAKLEIDFFRFILEFCGSHKLKLNIPETLMYGFGVDQPALMYTNETGYISIKNGISTVEVNEFFWLCDLRRDIPSGPPIAIIKTLSPDDKITWGIIMSVIEG